MDKMPFRLSRFAAVDNTAVDTLTSFVTKGLLTHYIRARPGERVDIRGLAQDHLEGRKAISDAQQELMRNGYLVRFRIQLGRGAKQGRSFTWRTKFVVDSLPITTEDVAELISEIEDADVVESIRVEPAHLDPRGTTDRGPAHRSPAHRSPVERDSVVNRENTGRFTSHRSPSHRAPVERDVVVKTESKTSDNEDETPSPQPSVAAAPAGSGSGGEDERAGAGQAVRAREEIQERAQRSARDAAAQREVRTRRAAQIAAQRLQDQDRRRRAAVEHLGAAAGDASDAVQLLCLLPDPPEMEDMETLESLVSVRLGQGESAAGVRELLCTTDREAWELVLGSEVYDPEADSGAAPSHGEV